MNIDTQLCPLQSLWMSWDLWFWLFPPLFCLPFCVLQSLTLLWWCLLSLWHLPLQLISLVCCLCCDHVVSSCTALFPLRLVRDCQDDSFLTPHPLIVVSCFSQFLHATYLLIVLGITWRFNFFVLWKIWGNISTARFTTKIAFGRFKKFVVVLVVIVLSVWGQLIIYAWVKD